jgi:chromosome segregation ATPase
VREKDKLSHELTKRMAEAKDQMGREMGGREKEKATLQDFLDSASEEIKVLNARVEEKEEEIVRVKGFLKEKSGIIAQNESKKADMKVC